jgi:hypothetical protein
VNNAAISASVLREAYDLEKMIVRHCDYERRIVARDDLALNRIGESDRCGSQTGECDEISRGVHVYGSTDKHDFLFRPVKSALAASRPGFA